MLAAALAGGCRRKVVTKPAGPCPRPEALTAMVAERGRDVRTACAGYPSATIKMGTLKGFPNPPAGGAGGQSPPAQREYWIAGALAFDAGTRANPKLSLLAGGQGSRTLSFDVQPAPLMDIARLIVAGDDVRVRIKLTQSSESLVRLGVWARPRGQPGLLASEVVVLLQLVAHAPPRLLWSGPGDSATKGPDGCIVDHFVDFQMVFGHQLSMLSTSRTRPGCPPAGPGLQEQIPLRPVPLAPGRVL